MMLVQHLKTDIYIEKSVKNFRVDEYCPIDSLIDFGKFIFKEKNTTNENNRLYTNLKIERQLNSTNRSKSGVNYLKYYGGKMVNLI
jgi:hypothetical protein